MDAQLDALLPPGGGEFHESLVVRQVMRRLVGTLVMEESLLLLEGSCQGQRVLERTGRGVGGQHKHWWALW